MAINLKNGVFWYRDEVTYLRFREIIDDPQQISMTYAEWVVLSDKVIQEQAKKAVFLIKIKADPDEFIEWCNINSRRPDSHARMAYAALQTKLTLGDG